MNGIRRSLTVWFFFLRDRPIGIKAVRSLSLASVRAVWLWWNCWSTSTTIPIASWLRHTFWATRWPKPIWRSAVISALPRARQTRASLFATIPWKMWSTSNPSFPPLISVSTLWTGALTPRLLHSTTPVPFQELWVYMILLGGNQYNILYWLEILCIVFLGIQSYCNNFFTSLTSMSAPWAICSTDKPIACKRWIVSIFSCWIPFCIPFCIPCCIPFWINPSILSDSPRITCVLHQNTWRFLPVQTTFGTHGLAKP